jgi:hypothetical protein
MVSVPDPTPGTTFETVVPPNTSLERTREG